MLICLMLIWKSVSLNSYGIFQPSAPKLRRSCTRAWKKQSPNKSLRNGCKHIMPHNPRQQSHRIANSTRFSAAAPPPHHRYAIPMPAANSAPSVSMARTFSWRQPLKNSMSEMGLSR